MINEYIKREDVMKALFAPEMCYAPVQVKIVKELPAADVSPVVHGYWEGYSHSKFYGMDEFHEPIYRDGVIYYCSECRRCSIIKMRFCPDCGARMDGGEDRAGC